MEAIQADRPTSDTPLRRVLTTRTLLIFVVGLLLIVAVGIAALGDGGAGFSRNLEFKEGESVFLAIVGGASLAFYALIGGLAARLRDGAARHRPAGLRAPRSTPRSSSPTRSTPT